jgi:hypothetical protein
MYNIMAYAAQNTDRGYENRNTYIQSQSQATIKATDICHINSTLDWSRLQLPLYETD